VQSDTLQPFDADLSLDFAIEEELPERLSIGAAFWVIAGLSTALWAAIVSIVSALP